MRLPPQRTALSSVVIPIGEEMIEETFKMFLELINVTEEEIDSVLPDKNLGAILVFAHNKKNNTPGEEE